MYRQFVIFILVSFTEPKTGCDLFLGNVIAQSMQEKFSTMKVK